MCWVGFAETNALIVVVRVKIRSSSFLPELIYGRSIGNRGHLMPMGS